MAEDDDPPEIQAELKKLTDAVEKAREVLIQALVDYGRAHAALAYFRGYRKAQVDSKEYFAKLAEQLTTPVQPAPPSTDLLGFLEIPHHASAAAFTPPANEIVFDAIEANPGLRGVLLLQKIRQLGYPLHERTFRTSLHRMRDKRIVNVNGGWYVKGSEPATEEAKGALLRNIADTADKIAQAAKGSPPDPKEKGGQ